MTDDGLRKLLAILPAKAGAADRLERFMALQAVRRFIADSPHKIFRVDAGRVAFAARLRGITLPAHAIEWAIGAMMKR